MKLESTTRWAEAAFNAPGGTAYQHNLSRADGKRLGFVLELPVGNGRWVYEWHVGDGVAAGQANGKAWSRDAAMAHVERRVGVKR